MKEDLNIMLYQMDIAKDYKSNLNKISDLLSKYGKSDIDILVLPEVFNTGFGVDPKYAASFSRESLNFLTDLSIKYNIAIATSMIYEKEKDKFVNRFVFVSPEKDGIDYYDKKHLFSFAGENLSISAGEERKIFQYKSWNILPIVCYDIRFPVWNRNKNNEYDIAICVANWPKSRVDAWKTLAKARAIENQSYFVACNREGTDHNNIYYSGDSLIFDAKGIEISSIIDNEFPSLKKAKFSFDDLERFRKKFPVYMDADEFIIK